MLQVSLPQEFDYKDVLTYQLLLSSYMEQFGFNVTIQQVLAAYEVTEQDIVSLYGRNNVQQNLLTISFTMGYDSRYGRTVDN